MPLFAIIFPLLALTAQQDDSPIVVTAYPWAPFLSPMGRPYRAHSVDDDPFARWFREADLDHDNYLSLDEMRADALTFFDMIDTDHDGTIGTEELVAYELQIAPEVQVSSNWKRTRQEAAADGPGSEHPRRRADRSIDGYQLNGLQGAARYSMLNIPEPVAGADSDLNGKISRDEFLGAAAYRFKLLDTSGQGMLSMQSLKAMLPSRPHPGRKAKPNRDDPDQRIAIPLPSSDNQIAATPSASSSRLAEF